VHARAPGRCPAAEPHPARWRRPGRLPGKWRLDSGPGRLWMWVSHNKKATGNEAGSRGRQSRQAVEAWICCHGSPEDSGESRQDKETAPPGMRPCSVFVPFWACWSLLSLLLFRPGSPVGRAADSRPRHPPARKDNMDYQYQVREQLPTNEYTLHRHRSRQRLPTTMQRCLSNGPGLSNEPEPAWVHAV